MRLKPNLVIELKVQVPHKIAGGNSKKRWVMLTMGKYGQLQPYETVFKTLRTFGVFPYRTSWGKDGELILTCQESGSWFWLSFSTFITIKIGATILYLRFLWALSDWAEIQTSDIIIHLLWNTAGIWTQIISSINFWNRKSYCSALTRLLELERKLGVIAQGQGPNHSTLKSPIHEVFYSYFFMVISSCFSLALLFTYVPHLIPTFLINLLDPKDTRLPSWIWILLGIYEILLMFILWSNVLGHDAVLTGVSRSLCTSISVITYSKKKHSNNVSPRTALKFYKEIQLVMTQLNLTLSTPILVTKTATMSLICCLFYVEVKIGLCIPMEAALVFWSSIVFYVVFRIFTFFRSLALVQETSRQFLESWALYFAQEERNGYGWLKRILTSCPVFGWNISGFYTCQPISILTFSLLVVNNVITVLSI